MTDTRHILVNVKKTDDELDECEDVYVCEMLKEDVREMCEAMFAMEVHHYML